MQKHDRLQAARNLSRSATESDLPEIIRALERRMTILETKRDFLDSHELDDFTISPSDCPWNDICVRHGMISCIAGVKVEDNPYPEDSSPFRRWRAGYSFTLYWQGIAIEDTSERLDAINETDRQR
jgi:hypothetical protein